MENRTEEEQAAELISQMLSAQVGKACVETAKKCALVACDMIIKDYEDLTDDRSSWEGYKTPVLKKINYCQGVESKIQSL